MPNESEERNESPETREAAPPGDPRIDRMLGILEATQADLKANQVELRELRERMTRTEEPDIPDERYLSSQYGVLPEHMEAGVGALGGALKIATVKSQRVMGEVMKRMDGEFERRDKEMAARLEESRRAAIAEGVFLGALGGACPRFRSLDDSPEFKAWMQSKGLMGQMNAAWRGGDASGAARIYNQYLQEQEIEGSREGGGMNLDPAQHRRVPQGAAPAGPERPPNYSFSTIHAFMRRFSVPSKREPGDEALFREYQRAQIEGRVDLNS